VTLLFLSSQTLSHVSQSDMTVLLDTYWPFPRSSALLSHGHKRSPGHLPHKYQGGLFTRVTPLDKLPQISCQGSYLYPYMPGLSNLTATTGTNVASQWFSNFHGLSVEALIHVFKSSGNLLTLTNSMEHSPPWEDNSSSASVFTHINPVLTLRPVARLIKKFLVFCGTLSFITVFPRYRHC